MELKLNYLNLHHLLQYWVVLQIHFLVLNMELHTIYYYLNLYNLIFLLYYFPDFLEMIKNGELDEKIVDDKVSSAAAEVDEETKKQLENTETQIHGNTVLKFSIIYHSEHQ